MQFGCDSCKAMLHIADEKVRGKRLVVRCKKCGAKITISDPLLAGARPASKLQPAAPPVAPPAAPAAAHPAAPAAAHPATHPGPPPASRPPPQSAAQTPRHPAAPGAPQPEPRPAPVEEGSEHDSDTESTRAMDSDMLEKALRASKRDDPAPVPVAPSQPPPRTTPAHRAEAEHQRGALLHRDPAVWFAMLGGLQTGPLGRAEIGLKIDEGAVGPRTYVWREGMDSWMRATDVAEVAALFAPAPETEEILDPPPPAGAQAAVGDLDPSTQDFGALEISPAGDGGEELDLEEGSGRHPELSAHDLYPVARARGQHRSPEVEANRAAAALGPTPGSGTARTAPGTAASRAVPVGSSPAGGPALAVPASAPSGPAPARAAQMSPPASAPPSRAPALGREHRPLLPTPVPGGDEPLRPVARSDAATTHGRLPPGERVHNEQVADELFNSSGEPAAQSAVDLARWASSELGKQRPSKPDLAKVAPRANRVAQAPDLPGLEEKPKADRTGEVLAFAGVERSRTPLVIALIIGALLVAGVVVWALSSDSQPPAKVETGAGQPADQGKVPPGGAGDPSGAALAAKGLAAQAPDGDKPAAQKPDAPASNQQTEARSPDNVGGGPTRGSGAAQSAGTPEVAKAGVGLTAAAVRKKVGQSKGALQGCIDQALHREPDLHVGKIYIATTIAPSGSVTATKIDKQAVDQSQLGSCLKRAARRIVFPSFEGQPFEVDIPIVVTAGD